MILSTKQTLCSYPVFLVRTERSKLSPRPWINFLRSNLNIARTFWLYFADTAQMICSKGKWCLLLFWTLMALSSWMMCMKERLQQMRYLASLKTSWYQDQNWGWSYSPRLTCPANCRITTAASPSSGWKTNTAQRSCTLVAFTKTTFRLHWDCSLRSTTPKRRVTLWSFWHVNK